MLERCWVLAALRRFAPCADLTSAATVAKICCSKSVSETLILASFLLFMSLSRRAVFWKTALYMIMRPRAATMMLGWHMPDSAGKTNRMAPMAAMIPPMAETWWKRGCVMRMMAYLPLAWYQ